MLKPTRDNILIEPLKKEKETKAGIIMPGEEDNNYDRGIIIATGPGKYEDNERAPLKVKKGDKVIFNKQKATILDVEGQERVLVTENDVLAKI